MARAALGAGRIAVALLAWGGAALIAACSTPPQPQPVAAVAPPQQEETPALPASLQPPRPAHKPSPPEPEVASLPPAAPAPEGSFDGLNGLDPTEAATLLGPPQQRAESPPAVLWRYASQDCELDVYFYLDLQSQQMRVLHYEVRDHFDDGDRSRQRCYGELVTERHAADPDGLSDRTR